jgi:hypothetical protein
MQQASNQRSGGTDNLKASTTLLRLDDQSMLNSLK